MRLQTVLLCTAAALVVTIIWVATPQLNVMLNEAETEVIGLSLFKVTPAVAKPAD
jgi:hypothetical protein